MQSMCVLYIIAVYSGRSNECDILHSIPRILLCLFGVPINSVQLSDLENSRETLQLATPESRTQALPKLKPFPKSPPLPDLTGGEQDVPVNTKNG